MFSSLCVQILYDYALLCTTITDLQANSIMIAPADFTLEMHEKGKYYPCKVHIALNELGETECEKWEQGDTFEFMGINF